MSFFAGLDTEGYDRQYSDRQLVLRMATYFRPHRAAFILVVGLLLLIALAGAATPLIVSRGVDILGSQLTPLSIGLLSGAILLAGVVSWGANWLRRRLTVRMVGDIVLALRDDAFHAAVDHDLSFYDQYSSGRIVSRITSDTQEFGQTVVLITDLFSQVIQAFILGIVLVNIDWRMSLYLFGFMPVIFLVTLGFRRLARTVTRRGMRAMANVNAAIKETVSGIAIAKNFRQEAGVFAEFDEANRQSYRVNVQRGLVLSLVFPVLNALGGIGMAILVFVGGLGAAAGAITTGAWFLFLQSLDQFFFPVLNLSAFWAQVQSGLSAAERVFSLTDAETKVVQTDRRWVPSLRGEIRFESVSFRYSPDEEPVLDDFDLHIHPGENLALVGHTGAGKSSIAKLIARFYEFQAGRILVDGNDIRSFDLPDYRRQLGIVSQVPFLFSGTIAENICYACQGVDLDTIEAMANQIGEGEWLESLPHGLYTEVGERGGRLSMGQRQLVSLLRVLVQRPAIFILDEATASIDPFTEWQIQQALGLILANTTSILIAHRLSTVKAADRIVVLENGRILEEGDHVGLLRKGGHYAGLYNTYFRHQSLDYKPPGLDEFLSI
ncbi:MAG TPA: ABC transporter ATP-binding protein [Anaerolineales bacterium]|nr:ABC transporter ATP-binding protein [Anaerolineales bacterium]